MNLSDIGRLPAVRMPFERAVDRRAGDAPSAWTELVARIGAEIATPLTAALERINALAATGKIDRAGLRALREEVEAARQAGMLGQQLTRFVDGRIKQSPERVAPGEMLSGIVTHRAREASARGLTLVVAPLPAVEANLDVPLLFGLLNAMLDWALANATGAPVALALEAHDWAPTARLTCRFPAGASHDAGPPAGDSLTWRLLEETARTLGVTLDRRAEGNATTLTLDLPRHREPGAPAAVRTASSAPQADDGFAPSTNSQPLAGSHVLVIASRRDLRAQVRDALRPMSLIVDFVGSVDEAVSFCREGLPHAVIVESIQAGERFAQFRAEVAREVPDLGFIEILEEGAAFEMSGFHGATLSRIGRGALASSLPAALLFELSRAG